MRVFFVDLKGQYKDIKMYPELSQEEVKELVGEIKGFLG